LTGQGVNKVCLLSAKAPVEQVVFSHLGEDEIQRRCGELKHLFNLIILREERIAPPKRLDNFLTVNVVNPMALHDVQPGKLLRLTSGLIRDPVAIDSPKRIPAKHRQLRSVPRSERTTFTETHNLVVLV
jgi:hypothetical protein